MTKKSMIIIDGMEGNCLGKKIIIFMIVCKLHGIKRSLNQVRKICMKHMKLNEFG